MKHPEQTISYWHMTARGREYPALTRDTHTGTLIIGGGITGITCAYCLAGAGERTLLIEADRLCAGTTGGTTGKCTIQHGILYSRLMDTLGSEQAALYAKAQQEALNFMRDFALPICAQCGFENKDAVIYASSLDQVELVRKEYEAAKQLGIDAYFQNAPGFPADNLCMTGFRNQGVIHPVRYAAALAEQAVRAGAHIYEHTKAVAVEENDDITVRCENGVTIRAKRVIQATQYPIFEGMGMFFARLYPIRTYGMAVEAVNEWPSASYINAGTPTRSLRGHIEDGRRVLIVVGESHTTARGGDMEEHYNALMRFAGVTTGLSDVITRWSAQDYKTPDDLPFIGRLSKDSNILVATGFGKWGITTGTLAGLMLTDIIRNGHSGYEELLSPRRLNIQASAPTLFKELSGQVRELVQSKLEGGENLFSLKPGEGKIVDFKGRKAGAYMSLDGRLTVVDTTCTHLGCEVKWNDAEKTWDCPCHGGRYSYDGRLLEGPPPDPLKILYREEKK